MSDVENHTRDPEDGHLHRLAHRARAEGGSVSDDGDRFLRDLQAAAAAPATTDEQRFLDAVDESRVVFAHPDTIERIQADGRWSDHFPSVRLVGSPYIEWGVLLSGDALAAWDLRRTL